VNKLFGVTVVGALLLGAFLYGTRGKKTDVRADPVAATATVAAGASLPPAAPATTTATVAGSTSSDASDKTACAHLADVCSTSDEKVDPVACLKQLADARKMAGAANVDRSEQCMADAKTCAAASGCLSGGIGMGAMGEYLKGLGSALSR
jgi:hypothetical protein